MSAFSASPADHALRLRIAHLRNLLGALPIAVWFGFGAAASLDHLRLMPDFARQTFAARVEMATDIFALVLFVALIVLLLIRRAPVATLPGFWPKATAALGFAFPFVLLALPHAQIDDGARFLGSLFSLFGATFALVGLSWLGRSFSILPQARALATAGPYALIRHPLYAAELLVFAGAALERGGPWALLLAPLAVLVQVPRMRLEEAVLSQTFPDYRAYRQRVPYRLFPGLY